VGRHAMSNCMNILLHANLNLMKKITTFVFLLAITSNVAAADDCSVLVPDRLQNQLAPWYPSFRMPLVTDSDESNTKLQKKDTGNACLSVAIGDFNGDGVKDYAINLTEKKGPRTRIVIAYADRSSWVFEWMGDWPDNRNRVYVEAHPAGQYSRVISVEEVTLYPEESIRIHCKTPVLVIGEMETYAFAYCKTKNKWKYTTINW
jgi:hypothetical protein